MTADERVEWVFGTWLNLASDGEILALLDLVRKELERRGIVEEGGQG